MRTKFIILAICAFGVAWLAMQPSKLYRLHSKEMPKNPDLEELPATAGFATFGAGCFWCVEEVFHQIPGVYAVVSGYMGGRESTANYRDVSTGRTDHAEVIHIAYDPAQVTFEKLLESFFASHDPTQLNRQGPDHGRQYRSVVFYHDDLQKVASENMIRKISKERTYGMNRIVTEVTAADTFYPAEVYHQDFARLNPGNRYLRKYLYPKLQKQGLKIPR